MGFQRADHLDLARQTNKMKHPEKLHISIFLKNPSLREETNGTETKSIGRWLHCRKPDTVYFSLSNGKVLSHGAGLFPSPGQLAISYKSSVARL